MQVPRCEGRRRGGANLLVPQQSVQRVAAEAPEQMAGCGCHCRLVRRVQAFQQLAAARIQLQPIIRSHQLGRRSFPQPSARLLPGPRSPSCFVLVPSEPPLADFLKLIININIWG